MASMTTTDFKNHESGSGNIKVTIDGQTKEYSSFPNRTIVDEYDVSIKEPAFPDPVTSFAQLTVGLGWILAT